MARALGLLAIVLFAACSSTKDARRVPTPLTDFKPVLEVKEAWSASVGKGGRYLFQPIAVGNAIYAAAQNGTVAKFDATTGQEIWRVKLKDDLSAGVGSDGNLTAVGTLAGIVHVLGADGKQVWQADASGEILAPPLVGQGLVIVRTIDGRVTAFSAQDGTKRWDYRNRAVPLNLRTTLGMIFAGTQAALVGFPGGSMAAVNIANGTPFWLAPVSYPQGVTEVERINDVSGAPTLVGQQTCAATFQGRLGCLDVMTGRVLWERPFSSYNGLAQDDQTVVAADDWSVVTAFNSASGTQLWQNTQLKSRDVSAPLLLGRAVVLGDYKGFVHFLSRDTGEFIAREKTDGSRIFAPPVLAGQTLVVQTSDGKLYAFQPR